MNGSIYRAVGIDEWDCPEIRDLPPFAPGPRALHVAFLVGPGTTIIRGVIVGGSAALAEHLDWTRDELLAAFSELERRGIAEADWRARLVFVPHLLRRNRPANPNVVKHQRKFFDRLPACDLKTRIDDQMRQLLVQHGQAHPVASKDASRPPDPFAYIRAWDETFAERSADRSANVPETFAQGSPDVPDNVPGTMPKSVTGTGTDSGSGTVSGIGSSGSGERESEGKGNFNENKNPKNPAFNGKPTLESNTTFQSNTTVQQKTVSVSEERKPRTPARRPSVFECGPCGEIVAEDASGRTLNYASGRTHDCRGKTPSHVQAAAAAAARADGGY